MSTTSCRRCIGVPGYDGSSGGASLAFAALLVVGGGAVAVNASGVLNGSAAPVAGAPTGPTSGPGSPTGPNASSTPSTTQQQPGVPVRLGTNGPISADEVHPVSLTATGTAYQWVLAKTPGRDCARPSCATVFATGDHGLHWSDLGHLPAPPATSDAPTPTSVSQLRVTRRTDGSGIYDAWAYGSALWTSHDSGLTWSASHAFVGRVTQLEAWGADVYAGVSTSVGGRPSATLYRSPSTSDDWTPVGVGNSLTSVQSIAAANGVVGLVDVDGTRSALYVSPNGRSWQRQNPCPNGTGPQTLSTASDSSTGVGSLWVTCSSTTTTVIRYMDTDHWGIWNDVSGTFGAGVTVAAQTVSSAVVAGGGIVGIERVSSAAARVPVYDGPVGAPVFFGFTDDRYGYLLNDAGLILSTTDGTTWRPYAVTGTQP